MKKVLAAICSAALFPTVASAHDFCVDGIYYVTYSDTLAQVVYRGYSYSSYSNEYSGSVVIPDHVSFHDKTYRVASIKHEAFRGCQDLRKVVVPPSVTAIGYDAFRDCSNLDVIEVDPANPCFMTDERSFVFSASQDTLIFCPSTFKGDVTIGTQVHHIAPNAFWGNKGISSVSFPPTLQTIGQQAFAYCRGLSSVALPDSLALLGDKAFWACSGITSVSLPDSLRSFGIAAFQECSSLASVSLPEHFALLPDYAFAYCSALQSVALSDSLSAIGLSAFRGCSALSSISIPAAVKSIGSQAFQGCSALASLVLQDADSPISLGFLDFNEDGGKGLWADSPLQSIYLGRNVVYSDYARDDDSYALFPDRYGYSAFAFNPSLSSLSIGPKASIIGKYSFLGCSSLANVDIPANIVAVGDSAFFGCQVAVQSFGDAVADYNKELQTSVGTVRAPIGGVSVSGGRISVSGCSAFRVFSLQGVAMPAQAALPRGVYVVVAPDGRSARVMVP